jgi:hypothetical protein
MKRLLRLSTTHGDRSRCVDVIRRADGFFCFKEFRRDPEDGGRWSVTADYSAATYLTEEDALRAARSTILCFGQVEPGLS